MRKRKVYNHFPGDSTFRLQANCDYNDLKDSSGLVWKVKVTDSLTLCQGTESSAAVDSFVVQFGGKYWLLIHQRHIGFLHISGLG